MAIQKVKLKGFPEITFTAKVALGRSQHMFVKLGTGDMGTDDFVIEVEVDSGSLNRPSDQVLAAGLKWEQMVWDAMLGRLHEHISQIEAEFSARSKL